MLPNPKYVANFRLRNRFFRGEGWIHTGRKWAPYSAPPGGETVWRRNWRRKWMDFSVFLFVVHRFYLLYSSLMHSTFLTYAFYILHSSSMHSAFQKNVSCKKHLLLMQKTFSKNASCKMYLWRMHHVKNILPRCILHSSLMQKTFYKMHVHNVTRILNCILITIQLYTIPTPVSIVTNILLFYNNL